MGTFVKLDSLRSSSAGPRSNRRQAIILALTFVVGCATTPIGNPIPTGPVQSEFVTWAPDNSQFRMTFLNEGDKSGNSILLSRRATLDNHANRPANTDPTWVAYSTGLVTFVRDKEYFGDVEEWSDFYEEWRRVQDGGFGPLTISNDLIAITKE